MTSMPDATWLVGCGNMAGAMVEGWRKAGVDFGNAMAIRPSGRPVDGVRTVTGLPTGTPRLVLLGFKPQKLDEIAPALAQRLGPESVVLSILAGVEADSLRARFPAARAIVRAMPNLPVGERRGVVAVFSRDAEPSLREEMQQLLRLLGNAIWVAREAELVAIGSVAGAGPAYVARFVAALAKAGEGRGLDPDLASRVALDTVLGTALMADCRGETMDSLARRVASPNGTTEAGLRVLDLDAALDRLIAATIAAAGRRSAELAAEARGIDKDGPLP